jgi:hypothetical protein
LFKNGHGVRWAVFSVVDPDSLNPDTVLDPGFSWPKIGNKYSFFKGRPSYNRSLEPSKENIQDPALQKMKFIKFFGPSESGSGSRDPLNLDPIQIRIHNTFGSKVLRLLIEPRPFVAGRLLRQANRGIWNNRLHGLVFVNSS